MVACIKSICTLLCGALTKPVVHVLGTQTNVDSSIVHNTLTFIAIGLLHTLIALPCPCQLEDLADASWAVPQLEALQQFAQAPLCLRCVKPSDVTGIPGFNRATASRIAKAVESGRINLDDIAEAACLTADQRLLLFTCTTMDCSCSASNIGIDLRTRQMTSTDDAADSYMRLSMHAPYGRAGGLIRRTPASTLVGGWLELDVGSTQICIGDYVPGSGIGLVNGSASVFGRSPGARLQSLRIQPRMKPWTSSYPTGAYRGVALLCNELPLIPAQVMIAWSDHDNNRHERALTSAIAMTHSESEYVISLQRLMYDSTSTSTSMSVVPQSQRSLLSVSTRHMFLGTTIMSETAADDSLNLACIVTASRPFPSGSLVAAFRWSSPQIRNPYAAPISSTSYLGNETGLCVALDWRLHHRVAIDASMDIFGTLSRAYGKPMPAQGLDVIVDAEMRFGRSNTLRTRLRYETFSDGWRADGSAWTKMVQTDRVTLRADVIVTARPDVRLRWRFDYKHADYSLSRDAQSGYMAFLDAEWKPAKTIRLSLRATSFSSAGIETAGYSMEVMAVGASQTVVGVGQGNRLTMAVRYTPWSWCSLSACCWQVQKTSEVSTAGAGVQSEIRL